MTWRHVLALGLVAALPTVAVGGSAAAETRAATAAGAAPPARVVAVVPVGTRSAKLTLLDARTLKPARPGWSRAVPKDTLAAVSPAGSRVAVGTEGREGPEVLVVDSSTGRQLERHGVAGWENGLYWLGGDGTRGTPVPLLVSIGFHCGSGVCGEEFEVVGSESSYVYGALETVAVLRNALMLGSSDPTSLLVWPGEVEITLAKMPATAPFRVVADIAHGRVYMISSAGLVATVAGTKVVYHRVPLNGKSFEAAWAGSGKIALWGEDGLGTIDTRTWKTHAIAPGVSGALATPYGIAAWTKSTDGIGVYKPDGTRRFQRLQGKQITAATSVGPTLYADTTARTRYSIDLRTGKATGPLPTTAKIVTPTLVTIP